MKKVYFIKRLPPSLDRYPPMLSFTGNFFMQVRKSYLNAGLRKAAWLKGDSVTNVESMEYRGDRLFRLMKLVWHCLRSFVLRDNEKCVEDIAALYLRRFGTFGFNIKCPGGCSDYSLGHCYPCAGSGLFSGQLERCFGDSDGKCPIGGTRNYAPRFM